MKSLITLIMLFVAAISFADTLRLNETTITQKTFKCANGGVIVLQNTRFGNVKKVVFSTPGHLSQFNYVRFWNLTDHYEGEMLTWIKIPNGPIEDDLPQGRRTANMTIHENGNKFIMTITPIRLSSGFNEFTCVGL